MIVIILSRFVTATQPFPLGRTQPAIVWSVAGSDHASAAFGIASVRMKFPRLYASAWSWRRTALAAKVRHDSRVHLTALLPSLIHCSAVPRWL